MSAEHELLGQEGGPNEATTTSQQKGIVVLRFNDDLPSTITNTFAGAVVTKGGTVRVLTRDGSPLSFDVEANFSSSSRMPDSWVAGQVFDLTNSEGMRPCGDPEEVQPGVVEIDCNLPKKGDHKVVFFVREGHGAEDNHWRNTSAIVGTPEPYPIWMQKGVDVLGLGTPTIGLLGLAAIGIDKFRRSLKDRKVHKQKEKLFTAINNPNFAFAEAGDGSYQQLERLAKSIPGTGGVFAEAINHKKMLADLSRYKSEDARTQNGKRYDASPLQIFINTFNNQPTESEVFGGLYSERDQVGVALLDELNRFIAERVAAGTNNANKLRINQDLIKDPEFYRLLLSLYSSGDESWFRRINRSPRADENAGAMSRFMNLGDEGIQKLLILHAEANGKLKEYWDEIYDAIKERCPKDKDPMGFESAQEFINTIELV